MNTFDEAHALHYLENDKQFLIQVVKAMHEVLSEQHSVIQQAHDPHSKFLASALQPMCSKFLNRLLAVKTWWPLPT
jgi:hypothetical protein